MKSAFLTSLTLAILVLVLSIFNVGVINNIESVYLNLMSPIYSLSKNLKARSDEIVFAFERSVQLTKTESDNIKLKEQIVSLQVQHKELTALSGYFDANTNNARFKIGKLIFVDEVSTDNAVVLTNELVNSNNVVVFGKSVVGIVKDSGKGKVEVMLSSSPGFVTEGLVGEKTLGIVKGEGQGKMIVTEILQEDKLEIGDIVTTSIQSTQFNARFVLGEVVSITENINAPFKEAEIKRIFDIKQVENVFIVNNED